MAAVEAAKLILARRRIIPRSRRGGTASGVARAQSIARGELQPASEIYDWFERHRRHIERAEREGKRLEQSKALQAAMLWGSWPMYHAARRALP